MQQQFSTSKNTVTGRVIGAKDSLVSDGQDSVKLGLEIVAGQAALAVIRSFVLPKKTSFIDKITGKGAIIKKIAYSTYGSLAIASTAHVLVSILAPNNDKLGKIAKLALNAAVVEATATLPLQQWTDRLSDKLFNNAAVNAVIGDDSKD